MDDDIGLKSKKEDPLLHNPNKKKNAFGEESKQGGHDTLGFLKRAEEETKQKEIMRHEEANAAKQAYKSLEEMKHNLDGFSLCQPDSFATPPSTNP